MTVREIIFQYLKTNGYDGLCGCECGCELSDLAPCDADFCSCQPGYKVPCDVESCCSAGWHMSVDKPEVTA
jgi:hypothetical protein